MNHLIVIAGPTGIGKTSLSIEVAQHFGCEIISSDSRQFYKEMSVGTAVPSTADLQLVKHHFIHSRSILEDYSVGQFEKDALKKINGLFKKNKFVVMVGGSGLYINAVLHGLDEFPDVAPEIRENLNKRLKKDGLESLLEQLQQLDPETYNIIEKQNPQRVTRALEICLQTGEKYATFKNKPKLPRNFKPILIGLDGNREDIFERIDRRVDAMINNGLLLEVRNLYKFRSLNALQTVGYREIFEYFDGNISLDSAIEEIKKNSRHYAKRQNTWFKKNPEINWFDYKTPSKEIIEFIAEKVI